MLAQADEPEHLRDAPVDILERHVRLFVELVADVLANRQRIEQRAFLEDHPEVCAHRHHLGFGQLVDPLTVHPHDAGVRPQQSRDDLERRRLAGAARAQDDLRVASLSSVKLTSRSTTLSSNASST